MTLSTRYRLQCSFENLTQFYRVSNPEELFCPLVINPTFTPLYCGAIEEVTSPSQDNDIDNQPRLKFFHTPLKYMIKEAPGVCQRLNARLPEIRENKHKMR